MNSHGDVVQLLNGEGKVKKTYEYDSFGNEVKPDKEDTNPFRYCGEYYDKETGEVYLRARYYQPNLGRFLTQDSYEGEANDPLSLHRYAYCGSDPVNQVDPSGHKNWVKDAAKAMVKTAGKALLKKIMKGLWNKSKPGIRHLFYEGRKTKPYKWLAKNTREGKLDKELKVFGFYPEPKQIYHTYFHCWQEHVGYSDLYDEGFGAGTNMKRYKQVFASENELNKRYAIWSWKGDYMNLGMGGEVGFYSGYNEFIYGAEINNPIYTYLKISLNGEKIINWDPKTLQWWITGFNCKTQKFDGKYNWDMTVSCDVDILSMSSEIKQSFSRYIMYNMYWKMKDDKTITLTW